MFSILINNKETPAGAVWAATDRPEQLEQPEHLLVIPLPGDKPNCGICNAMLKNAKKIYWIPIWRRMTSKTWPVLPCAQIHLWWNFCEALFSSFFTAGSHCKRCNSYGPVCLSVRPSIIFRCFVEMNGATIIRFSLSGSKIILVSGEVKIIRKFTGDHR